MAAYSRRYVERVGGLSKIRCLAARRNPNIEIEVELTEITGPEPATWRYGIGLQQEPRGLRRVLLTYERVWKNEEQILNRPDDNGEDRKDELRLTETHLEQISANRSFRPIAEALQKTLYLHLVPQLLKFPHLANRDATGEDPFGIKLLERLMEAPGKIRRARLHKIEQALKIAVPELKDLTNIRDEKGLSASGSRLPALASARRKAARRPVFRRPPQADWSALDAD